MYILCLEYIPLEEQLWKTEMNELKQNYKSKCGYENDL